MFYLVSDDGAHAAPPGFEQLAVWIILPIMQRICGDENSPSIVLSREEGKQENLKWWRNKPPSCHRPATHHSQQSYLMALGNCNVCYSHWRVGSDETAVLLLNIFDIKKSERSQVSPLQCLSPWIIIQHLHGRLSQQPCTHTNSHTQFALTATNNLTISQVESNLNGQNPIFSGHLAVL